MQQQKEEREEAKLVAQEQDSQVAELKALLEEATTGRAKAEGEAKAAARELEVKIMFVCFNHDIFLFQLNLLFLAPFGVVG
jgi:hypothetical protein